MTADPISGIVYPLRSVADNITNTMKPGIDQIGAKFGDLAAAVAPYTTYRIRAGSVTGTTSGGGDITVTYATPFPTATTAVSPIDTNIGGGIGLVGWKVHTKTAGGFIARATDATTGGPLTGFATTFDYTATGH